MSKDPKNKNNLKIKISPTQEKKIKRDLFGFEDFYDYETSLNLTRKEKLDQDDLKMQGFLEREFIRVSKLEVFLNERLNNEENNPQLGLLFREESAKQEALREEILSHSLQPTSAAHQNLKQLYYLILKKVVPLK